MTTIGIISDTHGTLPEKALGCLAGADCIIHAGDIGCLTILDQLDALAPNYSVLGNCDNTDDYMSDTKPYQAFTIDGVTFYVAHEPSDISMNAIEKTMPGYVPQVRVCGHTHEPAIRNGSDANPSELVINPGSASKPRGDWLGSVGMVIVDDGQVKDAWVMDLSGNKLSKMR